MSEELTKSNNLTLHSDGTSKFGQHYEDFQLSTSLGSYSLGLTEILTGSADVPLQTLKGIWKILILLLAMVPSKKYWLVLRKSFSNH